MELEKQHLTWSSKTAHAGRDRFNVWPSHPLRVVWYEAMRAMEIAGLDHADVNHVIEVFF